MRRQDARAAWAGATLVLCLLLAALVSLTTSQSGDYALHGPLDGDNAAPAIDALVHARLGAFFSHQPVMGLTSLLLRAPCAWMAGRLGAGELTIYGVGTLVCLGGLAWLGGMIVSRSRPGRDRVVAALAALFLVANPLTSSAITIGHPEEVLAIALASAAVLAASAGHLRSAGLMLGLAIGCKPWALLAFPVVLLVSRDRRLIVAVIALVVAIPLAVVAPLVDLKAFGEATRAIGGGRLADPFSVWWAVGEHVVRSSGTAATSARQLPFGLTRTDAMVSGGLLVALGLVAVMRDRLRDLRLIDGLALLALLCLVRCVLDPEPLEYNFIVVLVPLLVWELQARGGVPIFAVAFALFASLLYGGRLHLPTIGVNALSILSDLGLGALLVLGLTRRGVRRPSRVSTMPAAAPTS